MTEGLQPQERQSFYFPYSLSVIDKALNNFKKFIFLRVYLVKKNLAIVFGSIHYCYIQALMLTCFHLTKGRATFFDPKQYLMVFLQNDIQLYFKMPVCGAPFSYVLTILCPSFYMTFYLCFNNIFFFISCKIVPNYFQPKQLFYIAQLYDVCIKNSFLSSFNTKFWCLLLNYICVQNIFNFQQLKNNTKNTLILIF